MLGLEEKVIKYIEENSSLLLKYMEEIIRIPSENYGNQGFEGNCQKYVAGLYRNIGLDVDEFNPDDLSDIKKSRGYLEGRNYFNRPDVIGVYRSGNGSERIMLTAHVDVMPAGDLKNWTVDPWSGLLKDRKIYGRGSGDDKSGIIASYFALKAITDCGLNLDKDVVLASVVDEEYGGGNGSLAACLKYPCDTYINVDGVNFELWISGVGGGIYRTDLKLTEPCSDAAGVVHALNIVLEKLLEFGKKRKYELSQIKHFKDTDIEKMAFRVCGFNAGHDGIDLDTGHISFAFYTMESREIIESELKEIFDELSDYFKENRIWCSGFKCLGRYFEPAETAEGDKALEIISEALEQVRGEDVKYSGACLSDFSIYNTYGSKSSMNIGIGKMWNVKGGAHQPDEYIEQKDLVDLSKTLALLLMRWCGVKNERLYCSIKKG